MKLSPTPPPRNAIGKLIDSNTHNAIIGTHLLNFNGGRK